MVREGLAARRIWHVGVTQAGRETVEIGHGGNPDERRAGYQQPGVTALALSQTVEAYTLVLNRRVFRSRTATLLDERRESIRDWKRRGLWFQSSGSVGNG